MKAKSLGRTNAKDDVVQASANNNVKGTYIL